MVGPSPKVGIPAAASVRRREPYRGHVRTSFAKTLIIRSAQLNFGLSLGQLGAAPAASQRLGREDGGRSTSWSRSGDAGARQPW